MKALIPVTMLASAMLFGGVAFASDIPTTPTGTVTPAALKTGGMLKSADGHRIGFVDAIDTGKDGNPVAAQVIVGSRIVHVPAATITATDKSHLVTSLSLKEVEHL